VSHRVLNKSGEECKHPLFEILPINLTGASLILPEINVLEKLFRRLAQTAIAARKGRALRQGYLFRTIQCNASAGTRKKNTSTTRSWMKNSKTSLPNSFSSILKKCVAQDSPVSQNKIVTPN